MAVVDVDLDLDVAVDLDMNLNLDLVETALTRRTVSNCRFLRCSVEESPRSTFRFTSKSTSRSTTISRPTSTVRHDDGFAQRPAHMCSISKPDRA